MKREAVAIIFFDSKDFLEFFNLKFINTKKRAVLFDHGLYWKCLLFTKLRNLNSNIKIEKIEFTNKIKQKWIVVRKH